MLINDTPSEADLKEPKWGRVLIAGGNDWPRLGNKVKGSGVGEDLLSPHIVRSLSNLKIVKLWSGCTALHVVCIDIYGNAYLIGRNTFSCFGIASAILPQTPPQFAYKIAAKSLPGASATTKIMQAACARHHTVLVGSEGQVWAAGKNDVGQCGVPVIKDEKEVSAWTAVKGNWIRDGTKIVQVSCGLNFTLYLADNGWLYASGSHEKGQLGNGKTSERIVSTGKTAFGYDDKPILIKPFSDRKIVMIASGQQHSLALNEDGYVWAWGFAGYGRLGLGDQKDRLVPTLVPQFTGSHIQTRASYITCGPASSVVINGQKMFQIAGKFKMTGDGSSGSPYTQFKYIADIMSCKINAVACGGNGLFLITPADAQEVMCVAFGQGCANGELGLGEDQPKNATKPVRITPLNGLDSIDVAASVYTTYWLVHPNSKSSDLERWPLDIESPDDCIVCGKEEKGNNPLECEKCDKPYHLGCLKPSLSAVPEGEWFCPQCTKEAEDPDWIPTFPPKSQIEGATAGIGEPIPAKESSPIAEKTGNASKRKSVGAGGGSLKRKK
ncbi:hypothetical protein NliqN6_1946 [Naganishia liquefaciens]|uniref:PHD-type domain-containing protein n=1 Tax=Naganishia liquefaciens TaxID=104408 RepID=A0A8H3TRB0_9TREE|nr:hypothetical protein NliqN6_1946 [Naganishia liquefaciens]